MPLTRHDPMKSRRIARVVVGLLLTAPLLSSCRASSSDYRREAEKYLESDDLAKEAGYKFDQAVCEQPESDVIGVQFSCTATDNDGDDWEFIVEITGSRAITVISGEVIG